MRPTTLLTFLVTPLLLTSALNGQKKDLDQATKLNVPQVQSIFSLDDGDNLHIVIQKGFKIKGPGQVVVGKVTQPVYHGEQELVALGDIARGHITSIRNEGGKAHAARLLEGDLTMPRYANVTFDELIRPDGQRFKIQTSGCRGTDGLKMSLYQDKASKMSLRSQIRVQLQEAVHTPNKLQKLTEALVTSLPYHPNYLDEGQVFNAAVVGTTELPAITTPTVAGINTADSNEQYLHLRLLTSISSHDAQRNQTLRAVVSEPFYNIQHQLIYRAGTRLDGSVTQSKAAGWLQKKGSLHFDFVPLLSQQDIPETYTSKVVGVEAATAQALSVDVEGGMKATSSKLRKILALKSLVGPSQGLNDPSNDKTAVHRADEGHGGFGLLGSGIAQASASTAIGMGYYSAARKIYSSFIAKGSDVDLPINTALLLQLR